MHKNTNHVAKFLCDFCDKSFSRKDNLVRHYKDKHEANIETSNASIADTEIKEGTITEDDPLSYKPAIEELDGKHITVKYELEVEGVKREVDSLSATMDQDPLADAVKQEEDVLDIKIEYSDP